MSAGRHRAEPDQDDTAGSADSADTAGADPTETDHPVGEEQAAENAENEPAG